MGLRVPFAVNTYKSSLWLICVNYGELQNSDKVFSKSGRGIWLTWRISSSILHDGTGLQEQPTETVVTAAVRHLDSKSP
jgi:hypothetical protein